MKKAWPFLILALWLCTQKVCSEEMTATITAYNAVEMSGEVPDELWATFENENHSKGQVTAGKTATLSIGGWPACTVKGVTVYLHSNQSSGAGTLTLKVDEVTCTTISGTMADWVGAYSTETVPLELQGLWNITYNQTITLQLTGTENSIYIESVKVNYQTAPEEPYCVTLIYPEATRLVTTEICEEGIGTGVELPREDDLSDSTESWFFAGWSPAEIPLTNFEPVLYEAGTSYYPRHDERLWAVYRDGNMQWETPQCTERTEREVVIVQRNPYEYDQMMAGFVQQNQVASMESAIDTTEDGTAYLIASYIPYEYRYQLQWKGEDSARIVHLASQSYIGWNGTKLADNGNWWEVGEAGRHSFYFYHDKNASETARTLWATTVYDADIEDYVDVFSAVQLSLPTITEGLLLFDVTDLPYTTPTIRWSSNPFGVSNVPEVLDEKAVSVAVKCLREGRIVIVRGKAVFSLTGEKVK